MAATTATGGSQQLFAAFAQVIEVSTSASGSFLMGWMAPAPTDVAMRHAAGVKICKREEPPHASYNNRSRPG
jgi:hypothetical protein